MHSLSVAKGSVSYRQGEVRGGATRHGGGEDGSKGHEAGYLSAQLFLGFIIDGLPKRPVLCCIVYLLCIYYEV